MELTESQSLLLIVAAIYLFDCLAWVRRDNIAFRAAFRRAAQIIDPGRLFGNDHGGVIPCNPLPPLGTLVVAAQWPMSVSPEGVKAYVSSTFNPGLRSNQSGRFVPFGECRPIRAIENSIHIAGSLFVTCGSATRARAAAAWLARLRNTAPTERAAKIRAALQRSLDFAATRERWTLCKAAAVPVSYACIALWSLLFVVSPLASLKWGLSNVWPQLLFALVVCTMWTVLEFRLAHRAIYPSARAERRTRMATMLLAPMAAIRARDALLRDSLAAAHPLSVARACCDESTFLAFASMVWRDLRYPLPPPADLSESTAINAARWYANELQSAVDRALRDACIDPDSLLRAPEPEAADVTSYCPRCTQQFRTNDGCCTACDGVATLPFDRAHSGLPGAPVVSIDVH